MSSVEKLSYYFYKWKYFDKKYSIEQLSKEYTNSI